MESVPDLGQGRKGSWASWGSEQSPERPLGMEMAILLPLPFFPQGSPGFSSRLLPDTISVSFLYIPVFLPPRTHNENGHASSLLHAVLVPGPVVTDQKARVPIPDALEKTLVVSAWVRSIYSNNLWALGVIVTPGARPYGRGWGKLLGKKAETEWRSCSDYSLQRPKSSPFSLKHWTMTGQSLLTENTSTSVSKLVMNICNKNIFSPI